MKLLCLDFESFFSDAFTLKKLTTEAYIRDEQFKAHMVGLWLHDTMPAPIDVLPEMLKTNVELRRTISESAVLCHHAQFDGLILNHHFGLRPAMWLDTLSMARLVWPKLKSHSLDALAAHLDLPAKTVPYNLFKGLRDLPPDVYQQLAEGCRHDVWLTVQIFKALLPHVPAEELKIIDLTIRMFTEPVLELDRPRLEKFLAEERLRKARAMLQAGVAIGIPIPTTVFDLRAALEAIETELQSSAKFKTALEAIGYPCPMKWSKNQKCEIPALAKNDDGMKELLEHPDSRVQALAAARLGVKSTIDESRAQTLLNKYSRGPAPVYLKYAAAKTLRFGGGDADNWQNFRRGGEIRKSIRAPKGHKLVIGDESQIEYRLLLWVSGQTDKLDALVAGRDLYCEYASMFYGEKIAREDKQRRGVGKQGILMGGYGAGKDTMIRTAAGGGYGPPVQLTDYDGQRMVDLYRRGHSCVKQFWAWCEKVLIVLASGGELDYRQGLLRIKDHCIWLPNNTCLNYEGLRWARTIDVYPEQEDDGEGYAWWELGRRGYTRTWGSHVTADIIQALARVVIVQAGVKLAQRLRLVLQCHDEWVSVVPEAEAEAAGAFMEEVLVKAPSWALDMPLAAEITISEIYDK